MPSAFRPDARVEPVAQRAGRRVVDRVVDRAPGLAVDLGARVPPATSATHGAAARRRVVRLDDRRPAAAPSRTARCGSLFAASRMRSFLAKSWRAVRDQRVGERVGERLAVQVVAGGELSPVASRLVEEADESARLSGSENAAVRPEREADVRPVAVEVDAVAVVALEEEAALGDRAAPPAVGVRVGEVDDRLLQDVVEGRRTGLGTPLGHDRLVRSRPVVAAVTRSSIARVPPSTPARSMPWIESDSA